MQDITTSARLKDAIQLLEFEQAYKGHQLKKQLYITYESLKPVKLLRNTLKELLSAPHLGGNIMGTVIGIASGFLSKRMFVGTSGNLIRKLLGSLLQLAVTSVATQHPETIKSYGQAILQYFFRRKISNSKHRDS